MGYQYLNVPLILFKYPISIPSLARYSIPLTNHETITIFKGQKYHFYNLFLWATVHSKLSVQ